MSAVAPLLLEERNTEERDGVLQLSIAELLLQHSINRHRSRVCFENEVAMYV